MANEKRLIDANALKDRFKLRINWLEKDAHDQYSLGLFYGAEYDAKLIDEIPTVDAYTEEQVDSIIQKADLLEIENRNLEQEVDWLKNCLNCEIRNKCPRHCGKVVHGCDHWIDGDPMVHGHWEIIPDDYFDLVEMKCSVCGESWGFEDYEDCIPQNYHYCPNCGAKMDGDGNG